jgi:hypothetical protein
VSNQQISGANQKTRRENGSVCANAKQGIPDCHESKVAMKANKSPTLEDYLTQEEFRARFEAEKLDVQRHYCTLFGFWRRCRLPLCRRGRACRGDQHECLKLSVDQVPRAEQFTARAKLLQASPRNLPAPEHIARQLMPNSFADRSDALHPRDIPRGWTRSGRRRPRAKR